LVVYKKKSLPSFSTASSSNTVKLNPLHIEIRQVALISIINKMNFKKVIFTLALLAVAVSAANALCLRTVNGHVFNLCPFTR